MTAAASAQVRLPAPQLPLQSVPLQTLNQTLGQNDASTLDRLSDLRHVQITRLIRTNRRLVEADPNGEPIVRDEILALSPSDAAVTAARLAGFLVVREQVLSADLRVMVLKPPSSMTTSRALQVLRASDPDGIYDFNHIYTHAGVVTEAPNEAPPTAATRPPTTASPRIRVGLLDTGIESSHPIFRDSVLHLWGCSDHPVPSLHGTAVASLLLARVGAELYAADVYCGSPTGGAVDVIIAALGWMTSKQVAVINVSLVGPKNVMLERTIAALIARGYLIVAAVGNDGPTAPPLYPAAYPDVVGVTGVDAKHHALLEAARGPQVMFAALGADIKAANTEHAFSGVRGTSFAAPTVAKLLAELLDTPDKALADAAVAVLATQAIDLGAPGKDLTYGYGLLAADAQ